MKLFFFLLVNTFIVTSCRPTVNNDLTRSPQSKPLATKETDPTLGYWKLVKHFEGNSADTSVDSTERVQITDSTFVLERGGKVIFIDTLQEANYFPNAPKHQYFELKSKHNSYKVRFPDDYSFMYCNINGNDGVRRIYKRCN
ncbi:hypothetical protein CJD36_013920 [Flavipsychrobacter stenotrophus]|uniref:Uncharacterized protein n=1 Tax=Flavipsychrobacter stenotrophus TaxID=2077091 RepID=A0A2S7SVU3_9BACT|nr:hypothetical protein [Flavipsychrobacter stenotrophus]PQJ11062.1 hypothetical protein CJD36_013920 [Flavipsychrobacter stenotrophus]